jgi:FkbM family methyltransferase
MTKPRHLDLLKSVRIQISSIIAFACHHYPIDKGRRRIIWFLDWILPKGDYLLKAHLSNGGMPICCIRSDLLSLRIYCFGEDEPSLYRLLYVALSFPAQKGNFIDIGANLGTLSLRLSAYTGCKSICVEPQPVLVRLLEKNALSNNINRLISIKPVALSDHEGELTLSVDPSHLGGASLRQISNADPIRVRVMRLDKIISQEEWVNTSIVKVDVEGYEKEVFEGAHSLFSIRLVPIVFEVNRQALAERGETPKELANVLRKAGYTQFYALEEKLYPPINGVYNICNILASTSADYWLIDAFGYDEGWVPPPRPFYPVHPLII